VEPTRAGRTRHEAQKTQPVRAKGVLGDETRRMQVAMMAAASIGVNGIARGLKLQHARVREILSEVDTTQLIEDVRQLVRAHALSESLDIAVKGMAWVTETIDQREAKTFDLVARGLSNMERVWASAAGEGRPAPLQVAVINQPTPDASAEIAKLVELLVGPKP